MARIHLTVAAVIEQRGRFLMVEEHVGGSNVINQPAGHVELFYSAVSCDVLGSNNKQKTKQLFKFNI